MRVNSIVEHKLDRTYIGRITGIFDDVIQVSWNHIPEEQSCTRDELVVVRY